MKHLNNFYFVMGLAWTFTGIAGFFFASNQFMYMCIIMSTLMFLKYDVHLIKVDLKEKQTTTITGTNTGGGGNG